MPRVKHGVAPPRWGLSDATRPTEETPSARCSEGQPRRLPARGSRKASGPDAPGAPRPLRPPRAPPRSPSVLPAGTGECVGLARVDVRTRKDFRKNFQFSLLHTRFTVLRKVLFGCQQVTGPEAPWRPRRAGAVGVGWGRSFGPSGEERVGGTLFPRNPLTQSRSCALKGPFLGRCGHSNAPSQSY